MKPSTGTAVALWPSKLKLSSWNVATDVCVVVFPEGHMSGKDVKV